MTPKQKKFAALAPPRNKITYADKIAGATKKTAKRGKAKIKAQTGVAISGPKKKSGIKNGLSKLKLNTLTPSRITGLMEKFSKMSDQDRALFQSMLGKGVGKFGKALDKATGRGRMSDQDLALATKKKTTARRAGGLKAAVKKIKADKGKAVVSDRLKSLQKQTSMKMKSPKLVRMKALSAQTGRRRGR